MKSHEFITEVNNFDPYGIHDLTAKNPNFAAVKKADRIAQIIEENCGQMLNAYRESGQYLYRGIKFAHAPVIITAIRPDRKAGYLSDNLHNRLITIFTDLGIKANRANSIFCSANPLIAGGWGNIYIIFVKNGWTGTVFEKVKKGYVYDKISNLDPYGKYLINRIQELGPTEVTPKNLVQVLDTKFDDVLITGESYIALRTGTQITNNILLKLGLSTT